MCMRCLQISGFQTVWLTVCSPRCHPDFLWRQRSKHSESLPSSSWKRGQNKLFIRWLFSIQLELKHLVYRVLPSIPWGCFLHSDSFQLSDQFLAASPDRLSEFGEGATALKSVLCGPAVLHHAGPAGTPVTWTTDIKQAIVYIEIWSFFLFLDTVGH